MFVSGLMGELLMNRVSGCTWMEVGLDGSSLPENLMA
jgi:hypothetical protein